MSRFLWVYALVAFFSFSIATENSYGQAFDRGYKAFKSGDFRKAKKFLTQGLRKTRDRYDKALMYKLIGVSEYNLGKRSAAAANFRKAISLDPAIRLSRSETKNKGIISLFRRTKAQVGGKSRGQRRPSFRSARRGRSRPSAAAGATSMVENLIPFGSPQYKQRKVLTAAGLATGQAIGLFLFFERNNAAVTADKDAISVIGEQQNSETPPYSEEDFNRYIDENEAFVLKAREESVLGIYLFLGLWGAGIAEAILNPPKSTGRKRRRADIEDIRRKLPPGEELESIYVSQDIARKQGFHWSLIPSGQGTAPSLSWSTNF